jgi:hypothetical protein
MASLRAQAAQRRAPCVQSDRAWPHTNPRFCGLHGPKAVSGKALHCLRIMEQLYGLAVCHTGADCELNACCPGVCERRVLRVAAPAMRGGWKLFSALTRAVRRPALWFQCHKETLPTTACPPSLVAVGLLLPLLLLLLLPAGGYHLGSGV